MANDIYEDEVFTITNQLTWVNCIDDFVVMNRTELLRKLKGMIQSVGGRKISLGDIK